MIDKAYIVANKEQELDVLKKLEKDGFNWPSGLNPTNFFPSNSHPFPIVLFERGCITWDFLDSIKNETIVYDGRKDEKMSKKYLVTKGFMDALVAWRDERELNPDLTYRSSFVAGRDISDFPYVVDDWWIEDKNPIERNKRLIAIVSWLNGEKVFEVEKPHKFVVRSDKTDDYGDYSYVVVNGEANTASVYLSNATKFDTYEEAKEWANSHQVVVGVGSEG